jgi:hypothetical protein
MALLLCLLFKKGVPGGLCQLSDQALLLSNLPHLGRHTSGFVNVQVAVLTPRWAHERLSWKRQWGRQLEE